MTTTTHRSTAVAAIVAIVLLTRGAAGADEIKVMTSGAFTAAYLMLVPEFERATGHHLITEATSMGIGSTSIEARLASGEAIDVVIVAGASLEQLVASGRVVASTRVDLARSTIGMAVRKGAAKPDISTVDGLTRTLLAARSIAYSGSVSGTYLSTELFQRLGIADQVLPKSRKIENERVAAVVARGEAEIGFQQISELLPEPGIDFVGPLPGETQRVTMFSAGIGAAARYPEAARRLIEFLASSAAMRAIRQSGLEPVTAGSARNASLPWRREINSAGNHGTLTASPGSRGVWMGSRRACVACSKLYPSANSLPSLNGRPRNDSATGSTSPVKPAGTIRSGNPVRLARFTGVLAEPPGGSGGAAISGGRFGRVGYTSASSCCDARTPSMTARTIGSA